MVVLVVLGIWLLLGAACAVLFAAVGRSARHEDETLDSLAASRQEEDAAPHER